MVEYLDKNLFWQEQRESYIQKKDYILENCTLMLSKIEPLDFYRELFPEGFLETKGRQINWDCEGGGKPNAVGILITDKMQTKSSKTGKDYDKPLVKRTTITNDLGQITDLVAESNRTLWPLYIAPVSYFGKHRSAKNARYLHAFTVDLDGVGILQLRHLLGQIEVELRPMPTEIVLSGRGVHLYYRLEQPIPLIPGNIPALQEIKRHLIDLMWNTETSYISSEPEHNKRQYQGIYQAFRAPGSATRLSGYKPEHKRNKEDYHAIAFKFNHKDPYTLEELIGWMNTYETKAVKSDQQKVIDLLERADRTPLKVAKEQWPDWYERRIINGEPRKTFIYKRACYDKWLERITKGATVGHRYNCIMTLAAYAAKCAIPYEELEEDALRLFSPFNELLDSNTHQRVDFGLNELYGALDTYYDDKAITYTNGFMSRRAGLPVATGNRRNGRSQEQHLIRARFSRDLNCEDMGIKWYDNAGRPKGSKNKINKKRELVLDYVKEHPEANHTEVAKALGISRPTVIKWCKEIE